MDGYIWLKTDFFQHPKLVELQRLLGADGALGWLSLMGYATANRPDGRLTDMDAEEIAMAAYYPGSADAFVDTLASLGLLTLDGDTLIIHEWAGRSEDAHE